MLEDGVATARDHRTVQSVAKAFAVLEELSRTRRPASVAELASAVGQDRAVVHRLLHTLLHAGMVENRSDRRWTLGPGALLYGSAYVDQLNVNRFALPYLVDLRAQVFPAQPWVVTLTVPTGATITIIERLWAPEVPLATMVEMGMRLPIGETAQGRAVLAYMESDRAGAAIGRERAAELESRFREIRANGGVETSRDELRRGISAVAAAVVPPEGRTLAAIGVSGAELEPHLSPASTVAQHLRQTAQIIAASLP